MMIVHCLPPYVQVTWKILWRSQRFDSGTRGVVRTLWITKTWVLSSYYIVASIMGGSWLSSTWTSSQGKFSPQWGFSLYSRGYSSLHSSWSIINIRSGQSAELLTRWDHKSEGSLCFSYRWSSCSIRRRIGHCSPDTWIFSHSSTRSNGSFDRDVLPRRVGFVSWLSEPDNRHH